MNPARVNLNNLLEGFRPSSTFECDTLDQLNPSLIVANVSTSSLPSDFDKTSRRSLYANANATEEFDNNRTDQKSVKFRKGRPVNKALTRLIPRKQFTSNEYPNIDSSIELSLATSIMHDLNIETPHAKENIRPPKAASKQVNAKKALRILRSRRKLVDSAVSVLPDSTFEISLITSPKAVVSEKDLNSTLRCSTKRTGKPTTQTIKRRALRSRRRLIESAVSLTNSAIELSLNLPIDADANKSNASTNDTKVDIYDKTYEKICSNEETSDKISSKTILEFPTEKDLEDKISIPNEILNQLPSIQPLEDLHNNKHNKSLTENEEGDKPINRISKKTLRSRRKLIESTASMPDSTIELSFYAPVSIKVENNKDQNEMASIPKEEIHETENANADPEKSSEALTITADCASTQQMCEKLICKSQPNVLNTKEEISEIANSTIANSIMEETVEMSLVKMAPQKRVAYKGRRTADGQNSSILDINFEVAPKSSITINVLKKRTTKDDNQTDLLLKPISNVDKMHADSLAPCAVDNQNERVSKLTDDANEMCKTSFNETKETFQFESVPNPVIGVILHDMSPINYTTKLEQTKDESQTQGPDTQRGKTSIAAENGVLQDLPSTSGILPKYQVDQEINTVALSSASDSISSLSVIEDEPLANAPRRHITFKGRRETGDQGSMLDVDFCSVKPIKEQGQIPTPDMRINDTSHLDVSGEDVISYHDINSSSMDRSQVRLERCLQASDCSIAKKFISGEAVFMQTKSQTNLPCLDRNLQSPKRISQHDLSSDLDKQIEISSVYQSHADDADLDNVMTVANSQTMNLELNESKVEYLREGRRALNKAQEYLDPISKTSYEMEIDVTANITPKRSSTPHIPDHFFATSCMDIDVEKSKYDITTPDVVIDKSGVPEVGIAIIQPSQVDTFQSNDLSIAIDVINIDKFETADVKLFTIQPSQVDNFQSKGVSDTADGIDMDKSESSDVKMMTILVSQVVGLQSKDISDTSDGIDMDKSETPDVKMVTIHASQVDGLQSEDVSDKSDGIDIDKSETPDVMMVSTQASQVVGLHSEDVSDTSDGIDMDKSETPDVKMVTIHASQVDGLQSEDVSDKSDGIDMDKSETPDVKMVTINASQVDGLQSEDISDKSDGIDIDKSETPNVKMVSTQASQVVGLQSEVVSDKLDGIDIDKSETPDVKIVSIQASQVDGLQSEDVSVKSDGIDIDKSETPDVKMVSTQTSQLVGLQSEDVSDTLDGIDMDKSETPDVKMVTIHASQVDGLQSEDVSDKSDGIDIDKSETPDVKMVSIQASQVDGLQSEDVSVKSDGIDIDKSETPDVKMVSTQTSQLVGLQSEDVSDTLDGIDMDKSETPDVKMVTIHASQVDGLQLEDVSDKSDGIDIDKSKTPDVKMVSTQASQVDGLQWEDVSNTSDGIDMDKSETPNVKMVSTQASQIVGLQSEDVSDKLDGIDIDKSETPDVKMVSIQASQVVGLQSEDVSDKSDCIYTDKLKNNEVVMIANQLSQVVAFQSLVLSETSGGVDMDKSETPRVKMVTSKASHMAASQLYDLTNTSDVNMEKAETANVGVRVTNKESQRAAFRSKDLRESSDSLNINALDTLHVDETDNMLCFSPTKMAANDLNSSNQPSLILCDIEKPEPVSPNCAWPSPLKRDGSLGYTLDTISAFHLTANTKSHNNITCRMSRLINVDANSKPLHSSTISSTCSMSRRLINNEIVAAIEKQFLDDSDVVNDVEEKPTSRITLSTGVIVAVPTDTFSVALPVKLPDDLQLSSSNWDESKLMEAVAPATTGKPLLKHPRVSMLKQKAMQKIANTAINGASRRRSVQFDPVVDMLVEHKGGWDHQSVAMDVVNVPISLISDDAAHSPLDDDNSLDFGVVVESKEKSGILCDLSPIRNSIATENCQKDAAEFNMLFSSPPKQYLNTMYTACEKTKLTDSIHSQSKSHRRRIRCSSQDRDLPPQKSLPSNRRSRRGRINRVSLDKDSIDNTNQLNEILETKHQSPAKATSNKFATSHRKEMFGISCAIDPSVREQSQWLPEGVDQSQLHGILRKGLCGWKDPTDPIFIPLDNPISKNSVTGLRRSSRIRIRPVTRPFEKVQYSRRLNPATNRWEDVPVGHCLFPSDAEIRKRRKQLSVLNQELNKTRLKTQRQAKLEKLVAKRRREAQCEATGAPSQSVVLGIKLDHDVQWIKKGSVTLPIGHLVNPNGSVDLTVVYRDSWNSCNFNEMYVSHQEIAPSSGLGATSWPFEESVRDITCVLSRAQQHRGLHYDGEATNFFHFQSLPSTSESSDVPILFAVQIGNFAIPLKNDCYIMVPKSIPYKFMNASSNFIRLQRIRCISTSSNNPNSA